MSGAAKRMTLIYPILGFSRFATRMRKHMREVAMRWSGLWGACLLIVATGAAMGDDGAALSELAPTGKLRVAVAISPAPSALYAVKDAATGKLAGVTIDLGTALAKKLKVEPQFLEYLASGEIHN